ncbi:hypothetical protein RZS28_18655 (plasmid) [Methylocapsa polymorpha]|uniref:Uncharacterized protein n=1 Tax=Methylocapsa polymorpha TaxID=3080828 RepID=A0ABZ0HXW4_9HYPH|nr:hypothetical protein [Methylocapsa sp. RX1]WOJ91750.1 hypothetical protein RZS28_18655 [Methylocapsa sp. RX1]
MSDQSKEPLARIEAKADEIAAAVRDQNDQLRITNARLDELVTLLTPKESDPGEPTLGDLLAHLIALGGEQLTLARKTVDLLIDMRQDLPEDTVRAAEARLAAKPGA